jgi:hypothetical protein
MQISGNTNQQVYESPDEEEDSEEESEEEEEGNGKEQRVMSPSVQVLRRQNVSYVVRQPRTL